MSRNFSGSSGAAGAAINSCRPPSKAARSAFGADAVVMVAARADVQIVFPLLDEHHLLTLAAFVPEVVGGVALGGEGQGVARQERGRASSCGDLLAPDSIGELVGEGFDMRRPAASPCSAMMSMKADPTTTPSATLAMSAACAGCERRSRPRPAGRAGRGFQARNRILDARLCGLLHPGNPGNRDIIEEAARAVQHVGQPRRVGRRRCEADQVDFGSAERGAEFGIFLRGNIDADDAVDPAFAHSAANQSAPRIVIGLA